ncbi:DNA recombination protein RmuC [Coxiella endosymbiont of Amblyomma americanum]|uniref:DNA recombination protein RmuC n=1 Tax=Coxiella endosymbiont of Amblyomma americanum TaxID=325775 RepID=UPI00057ED109|nr:DNA recombination protein RmuC [Coxiella endosymbiont of Amblyomma americanum]AJC50623.1 RmuC family protein [Coxiella endosymbiont of Amblyomma americanum]AUJ58951.1 DNA recombination protein RmuC [Coxiella-like endosymbiont of Amblyomma americanum]
MEFQSVLVIGFSTVIVIGIGMLIYQAIKKQSRIQKAIDQQLIVIQDRLKQVDEQRSFVQFLVSKQKKEQDEQRQRFDEYQIKSLKLIQDSLIQNIHSVREQVGASLSVHIENLGNRVDKLTCKTQERLEEISGHVDCKLTEGFEKTTETFTDVIKRLTIIDEAQKKIKELSSDIVSLQEILSNKHARGTFGEIQLTQLIHNVLPESNYALQHTLTNGKRCDCILFLPEPTGNIVVDAKFPLENYQKIYNTQLSEYDRANAERQFRSDIKKHIRDIAEKYIIPGETADGAVMFIPAEAVFAEIHSANYPDLVATAYQSRVWLVSPTTMMAILTTARAVLKDVATRKQVHIMQKHLIALSKDFNRFQKRMDNLSKHIKIVHEGILEIHRSSKKITSRFHKIEKVEIPLDVEVLTLENEKNLNV